MADNRTDAETEPAKQSASEQEASSGDELPMPWDKIQGAIWLIGLAILAWQDWWWPGILILVAISGLTQAGLRLYLERQKKAQELHQARQTLLPDTCPSCGSPVNAGTVKWTGSTAAACPYCGNSVTSRESDKSG